MWQIYCITNMSIFRYTYILYTVLHYNRVYMLTSIPICIKTQMLILCMCVRACVSGENFKIISAVKHKLYS